MLATHKWFLIRRNLGESPGRAFFATLGIGVGMFVFLAAGAIAWGLQFEIMARLRAAMPERMISARRKAMDVGPLRLGGGLITDKEARALRDMPEVSAVWPQVPIAFPVRAEGELFGVELSTDLVVNGIDAELIRDDLPKGRSFACPANPKAPAPVLISRYFLDLYNLGYAEANGLPKLTESFVIGRRFRLVLGESTLPALGQSDKAREVPCEIVGLTGNPALLGVAMPADCVAAYNKEFAAKKPAGYNALHIRLRDVSDVGAVEAAMARLNLAPDAQGEMLRRLQFFLGSATLSLVFFGALVLFVALANVVNTFALILLQRQSEIGLLRAVGATRRAVLGIFLGEAALIGALGGIIGALGAWGLTLAVNSLARGYLPPLSVLPPDQSIMQFNGLLGAGGVLFSATASAIAAFPLALRATGKQPAQLLRQD